MLFTVNLTVFTKFFGSFSLRLEKILRREENEPSKYHLLVIFDRVATLNFLTHTTTQKMFTEKKKKERK